MATVKFPKNAPSGFNGYSDEVYEIGEKALENYSKSGLLFIWKDGIQNMSGNQIQRLVDELSDFKLVDNYSFLNSYNQGYPVFNQF